MTVCSDKSNIHRHIYEREFFNTYLKLVDTLPWFPIDRRTIFPSLKLTKNDILEID